MNYLFVYSKLIRILFTLHIQLFFFSTSSVKVKKSNRKVVVSLMAVSSAENCSGRI